MRVKTPKGIPWFEIQFRVIFQYSRESIELKLARNQIASSLVVSNNSDWSKKPMGTGFFFNVLTPFPSGFEKKGEVSKNSPSIQLKNGQRVQ